MGIIKKRNKWKQTFEPSSVINNFMELGKSYYFDEYHVYVHDPQKYVILAYRTKEFIINNRYLKYKLT